MSLARHRSRASVLIAVLTAATAAAAVGAASAPAASMAVDCEGFQAALNQAGPGDVITLTEDCTHGDNATLPFTLPARPSNQAPYTVQGSEADAGTTIDGNDETRLLVGDGTGQVIIRNLTFRDGLAASCDPQTDDSCGPADSGDGGAIRVTGDSPLTIGEGNNFFSNHADGNGGGAFLDHTGTGAVLVYDNVFGGEEDENTAGDSGGGLYVESDAPVTVGDDPADETAGNLFELNEAGQGGGVAIVSQEPEPSPPERGITANGLMTLENNTFRGNQATAGGGALVNGSDAPIFMGGNEFGGDEEGEGNFAIFGGGADVSSDRAIDVADNDFAGNLGLFVAGGLGLNAAQVEPTVTGNAFTGNRSSFFAGGALVSTCNGASLDGNTFEGNRLDLNFQFPGGEGGLRALRGTAAAGTVSKLLAAREKGGFPRFGAGLAALGSQCNGLERGGGPAPLTQADNRFRDNAIVNQGFESDAHGAGEYTQALELRSTNDRFVGNRLELAHNEQDGRGAGLAIEPDFQQVNVLRNLVAAGNEIVIPPRQEVRGENGADEPAGRGGGVAMLSGGADADLQVLDSTVEGNVAAAGPGIAGQEVFEGDRAPDARTLSQDDRLILHNSIVFNNTGHDDEAGFVFDGEVDGFPERDVRFSDLCVNGQPHDDGDGTDPNSNVCIDPLLTGPVGDEDVDQTAQSPTIDTGSNELVPGDLGEDYEGNPRIMDGNRDGTATVDMGAHEFAGATPTPTPTPVAPAVGCVNAVGPVRGRTLGPARLGRTRTAQRAIFRGAQLRARPGMDKYCASPNGLFRLGYPTGRILNRLTRGVRRAVQNRVVLILTTSRGVTLSGVRPGVTRSSEVPRRLRRTRRRVGKNTWFVTRTRADVLLLVKVQGGLVREIGIGDGRLARGSSRQLKRYLKTWQSLS